MIPLAFPDITEKEEKVVMEILRSGRLSLGKYTKLFEESIKEFVGSRYAVAVSSGTAALHLILKALEMKERDGMIVTPFTFIASANVALYEKAHPIFVDIEWETMNMDVRKIKGIFEKDHPSWKALKHVKDLRFLMAVDVFGHPLDWDKFKEYENKYLIIEDSCEALGSEYKGKKVGNFGIAGTFAFYPNKQITTGEGGIVITDEESLAMLVRSMSNQGRDVTNEWLEHVRIGYNYRIDEISAGIGYVQMKRIREILNKRKKVAERYYKLFADEERIILPTVKDYTSYMSWFVFVIRLNLEYFIEKLNLPRFIANMEIPEFFDLKREKELWNESLKKLSLVRDKVIQELNNRGIQSKNYFPSLHLQKLYRDLYGYDWGDYPISELASSVTIAIPFYSNLKEEDQLKVVETLKKKLDELEF